MGCSTLYLRYCVQVSSLMEIVTMFVNSDIPVLSMCKHAQSWVWTKYDCEERDVCEACECAKTCDTLLRPNARVYESHLKLSGGHLGWQKTQAQTDEEEYPPRNPQICFESLVSDWEAGLHILCGSGFWWFTKMHKMLWFNLSLPSFHFLWEAVMIQTVVLIVSFHLTDKY